MDRRVGRDDFINALELARERKNSSAWFVCETYDLKKVHTPGFVEFFGERVSYHLVPRYDLRDSITLSVNDVGSKRWTLRHPLDESPALFLDLARLYEQGYDTRYIADLDPVLAWVHRHGLLGVKNIEDYENPLIGWDIEEDVEWLLAESSKAWVILSMYEAAVNNDSQAAEAALNLDALPSYAMEYWESSADVLAGGTPPVGRALRTAMLWVEREVAERCRPMLQMDFDVPQVPSGVKGGWEFYDLLGAAYLQMYWLMASGGEISRCEHCGRAISLARDAPNGRKRRQDRRFCDSACRQAHYRDKKKRQTE